MTSLKAELVRTPPVLYSAKFVPPEVSCIYSLAHLNNTSLLLPLKCDICPITHLFGDVAVFIDVVKIEGPVELLGHRAPEQHRQADDKVLEADRAVSLDVKRVEQKVGVGRCICGNKVDV